MDSQPTSGSGRADDLGQGTENDQVMETLESVAETKRRIGEVPVETIVVNHVVGLYELAAIHLAAEPPRLPEAALAIDAVACLVEGLGDRLGDEVETLVAALQNIRLAFVQIKEARSVPAEGPGPVTGT